MMQAIKTRKICLRAGLNHNLNGLGVQAKFAARAPSISICNQISRGAKISVLLHEFRHSNVQKLNPTKQ